MRGTVLYGPRDIRFEDRETPRIEKPTDAILRMTATCVCGSDLWPSDDRVSAEQRRGVLERAHAAL